MISTSRTRPAVLQEHHEKPLEEIHDHIYQKSIETKEEINPLFKNFCDQGE